ncbi:hypothetical protein [Cyclobacterium roseum]|uniref:hypothetical protein n=1 Tax=Cyclobacterium roseum TaxID=2666137 RepID=UPI001391DAD6|nr:hypothetical protein [Cyclobacterium roseum]
MGVYNWVQSLKDKILKEIKVLKGEKGKDKVFSSKNEFDTLKEAREAFSRSKDKLFEVNQWSQMPGITSHFELFGPDGTRKQSGRVSIGDYILIRVPGPVPENWVEVISLLDQDELAEFVVSPSEMPQEGRHNEEKVSHFFRDKATSTFRVKRVETCLIAYEIGKNEIVNNEGEQAAGRDWINTLMAGGGWLGFQKLQWKNLTEYLIHLS